MRNIRSCRGFTLVTGLIFLVLLTMVGTTSILTSAVQQKASGNVFDKARSFQSAESALIAGENWINVQPGEPLVASGCSQPCVAPIDPALFVDEQTASWWGSNGLQLTTGTIDGVESQPYYYLEFISFVPDDATLGSGPPTGVNYYQVSSVGTGGTSSAVSVMTSTYSKRF